MRSTFVVPLSIIAVLAGLAAFVAWPSIDLAVSGLFARPGEGFVARDVLFFQALGDFVYYGSRGLGIALALGGFLAFVQRKSLWQLSGKAWLFLFLGLLIGPGLIANGIFKDHWGRARPREIVEFGGASQFSPALIITQECHDNCSFVSGDAAFGFYLPSFAYVVTPRRSRRVFWGGVAFGSLFAVARIIIGAHFLSDVLFAAVFMLLTTAGLHTAMFGREKTKECWKNWFSRGFYK